MSGDTDNARIWETADVYTGPLGTTMPTDTTTGLDAAWKVLGLLDESGSERKRDSSTKDFFAWGGGLVRTTKNKFKFTITVTCLEDNVTVWGLVNPGSEVAVAGDITTRTLKTPVTDRRAFLFEMHDGDVNRRYAIPNGEVTDVDTIKDSDDDMSMYKLTIVCYADGDGTYAFEITDDPQAQP